MYLESGDDYKVTMCEERKSGGKGRFHVGKAHILLFIQMDVFGVALCEGWLGEAEWRFPKVLPRAASAHAPCLQKHLSSHSPYTGDMGMLQRKNAVTPLYSL